MSRTRRCGCAISAAADGAPAATAPEALTLRSERPPVWATYPTATATHTTHNPAKPNTRHRSRLGPAGPGSGASGRGGVTFCGAIVIGPVPPGGATGGRG